MNWCPAIHSNSPASALVFQMMGRYGSRSERPKWLNRIFAVYSVVSRVHWRPTSSVCLQDISLTTGMGIHPLDSRLTLDRHSNSLNGRRTLPGASWSSTGRTCRGPNQGPTRSDGVRIRQTDARPPTAAALARRINAVRRPLTLPCSPDTFSTLRKDRRTNNLYGFPPPQFDLP